MFTRQEVDFGSKVREAGTLGATIKVGAKGSDYWRAVVIPSGAGKSTLAVMFGWVDPDMCTTDSELADSLQDMRHSALAMEPGPARSELWRVHNIKWWRATSDCLGAMLNEDVRVVMLHSVAHAKSLGIEVIAVCCPTLELHETLIANRPPPARELARNNRLLVESEIHANPRLYSLEFADPDDRDEKLVELVSSLQIVCGAPGYRGDPNNWKLPTVSSAYGYAPHLPPWVYSGQAPPETGSVYRCAVEAIDLVSLGKVPRMCADYWMSRVSPEVRTLHMSAQATTNDWIVIAGRSIQNSSRVANPRVGPDKDWWSAVSIAPPGTGFEIEIDSLFPHEAGTKASSPFNLSDRLKDTVAYFTLLEQTGLSIAPVKAAFNTILDYHCGASQHFVATMIEVFIHHVGGGLGFEYLEHMHSVGFFDLPRAKMKAILGDAHNLLRQTGTWFGAPVTSRIRTHLMYVNQVVGKVSGTIPAMEEISKRLDPVLKKAWDPRLLEWTTAQYVTDSLASIEEELAEIEIHGSRHVDMIGFWQSRWRWTAGGAASGAPDRAHIQLLGDLVDHAVLGLEKAKVRLNKRGYFEIADLNAITAGMSKIDVLHSTVVTKSEIGKLRALLPGNLLHYFVTSYVLGYYERSVGNEALMMLPSDLTDLDRMFEMIKAMSSDRLPLMMDYADYNAQHYLSEMRAIMRGLRLKVEGRCLPREFLAMAELAEVIVSHAAVYDDNGKAHWILRGLFTGWRSTHFINTALNGSYKRMICKNVFSRWGLSCVIEDYNGSGDDLFSTTKHWLHAVLFITTAEAMGFELQSIKQLLGEGEFLRRSFSGTSVTGSPIRSLTQFCSGNWLSAQIQGTEDRLRELRVQIGVQLRRGVLPAHCANIWLSAKRKWARVCIGDNVWRTIPNSRIHGCIAQGGWGIPDQDGYVWRLKSAFTTSQSPMEEGPDWKEHKMTDDEITNVVGELSEVGIVADTTRLASVAKRMAATSFAGSMARITGHAALDRHNLENIDYFTEACEKHSNLVFDIVGGTVAQRDLASDFVSGVRGRSPELDKLSKGLVTLEKLSGYGVSAQELASLISITSIATALPVDNVAAALKYGLGSRLGTGLRYCDELLKPAGIYLFSRGLVPGTVPYEESFLNLYYGLEALFPGINSH